MIHRAKPSGEIRRGLSSFPRTRLDEKPAPKRVSKGDEGEIKGERRYRARRGAAMIFKMLIADTNLSNYRVIMSSSSSSSGSISNSQA